jgi:hypothetical protein
MSTEMRPKTIAAVVKTMDLAKIPAKINPQQVMAFREKTTIAFDTADALIITDLETKVTAEAFATACSDLKRRVEAWFKPKLDEATEKKRQATAEKAEIDAVKNTMTAVLKDAQDIADRKVREYIRAENQRIEDANRKRELEAQKKAEEEKKAKVAELKDIGTPEAKRAAKELSAAPVAAAPVELERKIGTSAGTVNQMKWEAKAIPTTADETGDEAAALALLIEAAYKEPEKYVKYLMINWPAINKAAVADKEKFAIPGFLAVDVGKTLHK